MARPGQPSVAALNSFLCLFLSIFFLFASGCSVGSFLSAYFNTYHNAKRDFSDAEDELLAQQDSRQADTTYLAPFTVPANAKTKFASVIEKGSKLLQYHSESSLVDDALMLIGKSYYYQNDNQQAERKFRELLDQFPESDLAFEARLLLANTLYRSGDFKAAQLAGKELLDLASSEGEGPIVSGASMLLGTIEYDNKNISAAREYYQKAAENGDTPEQRFRGFMRVAEMSVRLDDYEGASVAYRHARDVAETYAAEYKARIGLARVQSKLGQHEASLAELEDLLSDPKNRDLFGEVDLEIGNVYRDMGDVEAAIQQYQYVDSTYVRTEVSAKSYYELGLLYEKNLMQYDSAQVVYNKGKAEAPQATITALLGQRADYMNRYAMLRGELYKNDSLKQLILYPPVISDTGTLPDTTRSVDTTALGTVSDSLSGSAGQARIENPIDSVQALVSDSTTLAMRDSSSMALVPDSLEMPLAMSDSLGKQDTTKMPKPQLVTVPLDTVEARLAYAKSELASLFYTSLGVPDSAEYWYNQLLIDHPVSVYVPQALYTLAQIYSQDSTFSKSTVDSLYSSLIDRYPDSEFAISARKALGLAAPEPKKDAALELYSHAEELRAAGKNKEAIETLKALLKDYPDSPLASKAQFAIGWLYEEATPQSDSSISNYQRLVTLYPNTEYARVAKSKLEAVEQYKRGLETDRVADSIKNAQQEIESRKPADQGMPPDSTNMQEITPPEKEQEIKKEGEERPRPPGEEPLEKPKPQ